MRPIFAVLSGDTGRHNAKCVGPRERFLIPNIPLPDHFLGTEPKYQALLLHFCIKSISRDCTVLDRSIKSQFSVRTSPTSIQPLPLRDMVAAGQVLIDLLASLVVTCPLRMKTGFWQTRQRCPCKGLVCFGRTKTRRLACASSSSVRLGDSTASVCRLDS